MKKISIIIPCYNEEKGIEKVISDIPKKKLLELGYEIEIIVIDNNSKDKTSEVAKSYGVNVLFEKKQGKVPAMMKGFKFATGEIFVTIDGDNTYPSHEIPTLIRAFDGVDLVVGSRFNSIWNIRRLIEPREMPFQRVFANKVGAEMGSIILSHRITDVTSGLRAFRSDLLSRIPPIKAKGLDFEAELTARIIANGLKYKEVRITSNAREGHSSLNYFVDAFKFLWAMIVGKYNLGATRQKTHFAKSIYPKKEKGNIL
jgi:glycosyltransferase involved in cell wall biosynthesis